MDIIDRAAETEEQFRAAAIAAARSRSVSRHAQKICAGCGKEIPERRRIALLGCIRCVVCQEKIERENG